MKDARHQRPHIVQFCLYEMSKTVKSIKTRSRRVVGSAGTDDGKWVVTADEYDSAFRGEKSFKIDCVDDCITL